MTVLSRKSIFEVYALLDGVAEFSVGIASMYDFPDRPVRLFPA